MELDPAIVIPGHGGLITNVQQNGENILKRLASFHKDPSRAAWHITRRFFMYGILSLQPLSRQQFAQITIHDGWVADYVTDLNLGQEKQYSANNLQALIYDVIDEFIGRGLVLEKEGLLTAIV